MIPLLMSPVTRIALAILAGIFLLSAVYLKISSDARSAAQGEIAVNTMERVNEAVRAGDALRTDPERVRDMDKKYCRDC